jgi:hypothetical protein
MKSPIPGRSPKNTGSDIRMQAFGLVLAVLLAMPTGDAVGASAAPSPWIQVNRPIVSVQLGFVTHSDGTFYTGGSDGMLLSSPDGRTVTNFFDIVRMSDLAS